MACVQKTKKEDTRQTGTRNKNNRQKKKNKQTKTNKQTKNKQTNKPIIHNRQ